jgi:hypothetical protein
MRHPGLVLALLCSTAGDAAAQAQRIVAGYIIEVKPDYLTLYRARFDSTVPGGFEKVTIAVDKETRVFFDETRATLSARFLDQPAVVRFVERSGGQRLADEIRVSRRQPNFQPSGPPGGAPRRDADRSPVVPAPRNDSNRGPSIPAPRRGQVITGDITAATPTQLTVTLDRDMNTAMRRGTVYQLAINKSTTILYYGRPADALSITPGGKATVTFVEDAGAKVATEINVLAGSGGLQPLGRSEGSGRTAPPVGGFNFFNFRVLREQKVDQPPITRVRSGELHQVLIQVDLNRATGTPVSFNITTDALDSRNSSAVASFTFTPEVGFTGRMTKWFDLMEGPKRASTPKELTAIVTMGGVSQKRTFRYWADPPSGATPPKPSDNAARPFFRFLDVRVQSGRLPGNPVLTRVRAGELYYVMLYIRLQNAPNGAPVKWSFTIARPGEKPEKPSASGTDKVEVNPALSDDVQFVANQRSNYSGTREVELEVTATVTVNGYSETKKTKFTLLPANGSQPK